MVKKFIANALLLACIALVGSPTASPADNIPVIQATSVLQTSGTSSSCVVSATGSCVQIRCPNGQSTAVVYVPAGTLSGTVTVYTAPDVNGSAGVYGSPDNITPPNSTTYTQSLAAFPGKLYVTLGAEQYVEAVLTTATSGSATATITCSGSIARAAGSGGGGGGAATPCPSNPYVATYACMQSAGTPSPQAGYLAIAGTPAPSQTAAPVGIFLAPGGFLGGAHNFPAAIQITGGAGGGEGLCEGTGMVYWGTDDQNKADPEGNVPGQAFSIECAGGGDNTLVSVDTSGNLGIKNALKGGGLRVQYNVASGGPYGIDFSAPTSDCQLSQYDNGSPTTRYQGIIFVAPTPGADLCTPVLNAHAVTSPGPLCASPDPGTGLGTYYDVVSCWSGSTSSVTLHPAPTPSPSNSASPDNGWASTQYGYFAGPEPSPPAALNKALYNYPGIGCGGAWVGIGSGNGSVAGITDGSLGLLCGGTLLFSVDSSGNVGIHSVAASAVYEAIPNGGGSFPTCGTNCDGFYFSGTNCGFVENTGTDVGDIYMYNPSGNRCGLSTNGQNAQSATCTDNSSHPVMVSCSAQSVNYGEVTCTTVSSTTCTATATVRSGARCQATMETNDSTLAGPYYDPSVHTVTTTLTVTMKTSGSSGSANLAANYWCP